jgi:hypothetical protein
MDITHALRREITCSLSVSAIFFFSTKKNNLVTNKTVLAHKMKAYRGSRCIAPLILNLNTRWR